MSALRMQLKGKWIVLAIGILAACASALLFFARKYEHDMPFFFARAKYLDIPKDAIKKVVLDNGMTVLVHHNPSVPKVLVQIAYDVGSAIEQPGEKGLAHLIEHMIFKGTDTLSESDIDTIARKYGATHNAFTSQDVTSYYFEADKANWQHFLPILADCMQNARFDSGHLASEVKTVIQELRMRKDNYGSVMFEKAMEGLFSPEHPYHFPIIGYKNDLAGLTAKQLQKFYRKYYHPSKATLFVIGDVDTEQATKLAQKHFGGLEGAPEMQPEPFPDVIDEVSSSQTRIYRQVSSPQYGLFWRTPGKKSKESLAAQAAAYLLSWGENSRLQRLLVDDEKVATAVSATSYALRESGVFMIRFFPKPGKEAVCRQLIAQELHNLATDGPTRSELRKIAHALKREFFEETEDYTSFAYDWIGSFFATGDELSIYRDINAYFDMTSRQVSDFITQNLDSFAMSEVSILPIPEDKIDRLQEARTRDDMLDARILKAHVRTTPKEAIKAAKTVPAPTMLVHAFPKPDTTFTMPNGLRVLITKRTDAPFFSARLMLRDAHFLGQAKQGIALGLMMEMLGEGSVGYNKKESAAIFENEGADVRFGATGASLTTLSERYKNVLRHFGQVLTKPAFDKVAFEKVKAIAIDSYQRVQNNPQAVAMRILKNLSYPDHPFNWSFEEAISIVKSLTIKDLEELHKQFITPSSMILSVVGDVGIKDFTSQLSAYFGSWQGGAYKTLVPQEKAIQAPAKNVDYYMLRDQAVLALGQPSPIDIYHPDLIALKLLNYISWHSLGSRLFDLREESGLFYTAGGGYGSGAGQVPGYDYLFTILNVESIAGAEESIRAIVAKIAQKGVSEDEVRVARQLYAKGIIDLTASNNSLACAQGQLEAFGLGFDWYDQALKKAGELNAQDLNAVAKKYFSTEKMSRVRVGRIGDRRR